MPLFRAVRHPDFVLLLVARTTSRLGDGIHDVALAWLVLQVTGSAAAMGIVLAAQLIPMLLLLLVGGAAADRWPKLRLMVTSDVARAGVVFVVAALIAARSVGLAHLVGLGIAFGLADALFVPASAALLPELVGPQDRASANAVVSLTARLAGIAGPAVGAGLVAIGGSAAAFAVDGGSFLVSAGMLSWLAVRRSASAGAAAAVQDHDPHDDTERARTTLVREISDGVRSVRGTPWIAIGIVAAGITNVTLAGPLEAVVPLLVGRTLHADVGVLGLYGSLVAIGAVVAAVVLGSRGRLRRRWRLVYGPWVALALACAAMGLPIGIVGVLAAAVVVGFGDSALGLAWTNALQDTVPPDRLGRVSSLDYLGSAALVPIGYIAAGTAADAFGPPLVFLAGGLISAAILGSLALLPQVRAMD